MTRNLRYLCKLLLHPLYFFGSIMPRKKNKWLFATHNATFSDNSKYLFLKVLEEYPEIEAIWIANSKDEFHNVRSKGFRCYMWYSILGLYHSFTAGVYLTTDSVREINRYASEGACWVYLGHGIGLKKTKWLRPESYFLALTGYTYTELATKFRPKIEYYLLLFRVPDLCLTTSFDQAQEFYMPMFRIPIEKCILTNYPRNEILLCPEEKRTRFIERYEPKETCRFIELIKRFKKVYIYMPTWRNNGSDFLKQSGIDFKRLEEALQTTHSCFILKLHPFTQMDLSVIKGYSHIIPFEKQCDVNTILPYTNCLITDYSSVYSDFILLGKEIIIFPFDLEDSYNKEAYDKADFKNKKWYSPTVCFENYNKYYLGKRVQDFDELITLIANRVDCHLTEEDHSFLMKAFWDSYDNGIDLVAEIKKRIQC